MKHFTKQLLYVAFLLLTNYSVYAQNKDCKHIPDESNRNRFEIDDKRFEYPFTMFNKRNADFNLTN